jgi:hypothetical protein
VADVAQNNQPVASSERCGGDSGRVKAVAFSDYGDDVRARWSHHRAVNLDRLDFGDLEA